MDQHASGENLRQAWKSFPNDWREQQLLQEFSQVVQEFHATKQYIERGHTLDAFSSMLQTMTHWARIVVIEKGMHPEVLVWEQVREYNAGVYKLYEELLTSNETIAQRVELVMLAAEFSMMSKMKSCCALLIRILETNEDPLTIDQIRNHQALDGLRVEWSGLLSRLAKRGMIREVHLAYSEQLDAIELAYCKN